MSRGGTNAGTAGCAIPVGMYIFWDTEGSPALIYPNTIWERYTGKFLFSATDANGDYPVGSTGGEVNHTLTLPETPYHAHGSGNKNLTGNIGYGDGSGTLHAFLLSFGLASNRTDTDIHVEGNGGDQPHNNMPPYLAAYCWKRIA